MQTRLKKAVLVGLATLLMVPVIFAAFPQKAFAVNSYSALDLTGKSQAWVMGRAVAECIADAKFDTENYSESDMGSGKWLNHKSSGTVNLVNIGEWSADIAEGESDDSQASCRDVAKKTLEIMGWNVVDALCEMNRLAGKEVWERERGDCADGTGDFDFNEGNNNDGDTEIWNRFFRNWIGGDSIEDTLTNGMRYVIYSENFFQECSKDHGAEWNNPRIWTSADNENDDFTYKLKWNKEGATPDKEWYVVSGGNNKNHEVHIDGFRMLYNDDKATCRELADRINTHAAAYLDEIGDVSDPSNPNNPGGGSSGSSQPTCESEGGALAWILCAVLKLMDATISFLDQKVNELLFIDSDVYNARSVRNATGSIQNIALLILVPIMIFMVIGTALNFGPFDPYTVKKALPRMFIAAIFIVLSLPITQFGVELSNNFGQGLGNLIVSAVPEDQRINSLQDILSPGEAGGFTALTLLGVAGAAVSGALTIGIAASIALVTLIALLLGFIILIMRQVLLLMLIVIAPLAILAWIFPGNDKLWGIWKTTFIAMLMMYPIIAVLIASGKFVAGIAAF